MYGKKLSTMKLEGGPLPETKQRLPAGVLTALMAGSSQELAPGVEPLGKTKWMDLQLPLMKLGRECVQSGPRTVLGTNRAV